VNEPPCGPDNGLADPESLGSGRVDRQASGLDQLTKRSMRALSSDLSGGAFHYFAKVTDVALKCSKNVIH
jgi:hypothetical protein